MKETLLEAFKKTYVNTHELGNPPENPGVSMQLINWLETQQFPREPFLANDPLISQKLLIREGIEMVLRRLRLEYNVQERMIAESHGESQTVQPR